MPGPVRTPKEQRERRRARAAERRALEALANRIRNTTLNGYEAAQRGDTSNDDFRFQGGVTSTRPDSDVPRSENREASNRSDTSKALLLRIEHLERHVEREVDAAVLGVAEHAAEETRVRFLTRLSDASAKLATAREETRVANTRIEELKGSAPQRAAERAMELQTAVEKAVREEKERGDARLRFAADAVAENYQNRLQGPNKDDTDELVQALRLELQHAKQAVLIAEQAAVHAHQQNQVATRLAEAMSSSHKLANEADADAFTEDVDELRRAAIAVWGWDNGKWGKRVGSSDARNVFTHQERLDDGATIRRVAAKLRSDSATGKNSEFEFAQPETMPSREPLLARYA